MKKLLKYLKEYRLESFLGPLFKLLEASFELMVPLVMAKVIDVGYLKNGRNSGASWSCGAGLFHYGPVFCGKGGRGIRYGAAK